MKIMTAREDRLSEEDCAVIQAAALFEQLADEVNGMGNSARLLQNAVDCFSIQVQTFNQQSINEMYTGTIPTQQEWFPN